MGWFTNIVDKYLPKKPEIKPIPEKKMIILTSDQLISIMPSCPSGKSVEYAEALSKAMDEAQINTVSRMASFLGQIAHESNQLRGWMESLNYSAKAITKTWPKRFPTIESATPYARNPEKLANKVYSNRMGNGDEASGEGWKYRGRGPLQITGKESYRAAGTYLKIDLENNPDLAIVPENGFRIATWYWTTHNLNALADKGDFVGITKAINGGTIGLAERQAFYQKALSVLGSIP